MPFAYHNSRELACREPFGAVETGAEVCLRLFVGDDSLSSDSAELRLWHGAERFVRGEPARHMGRACFTFRFRAPGTPCVMWYSFRLHTAGGLFYVGAASGALRSGRSETSRGLPRDFRITVFDKSFTAPKGFASRIAYQVFPDRFRRGEYPGLDAALEERRALSRRVTVKEWGEEVDFLPRGSEPHYSPQDYYLGNFRGIEEGIPHLISLGVRVLYLNPVFESAYNHRYSISDYMRIDPLLGTEQDFVHMASALRENGIKLILDGVFSHTGDDSLYFDKRGNYGGGAYSDPSSPYREWYDFDPKYTHGYRCWWDFETLPEVEEMTPSYMEFVARVLEKWVRLGASGWRLDVADELPDAFIKFLRARLKAIDPEAILIGEVWEDAVLKRDGAGVLREYALGQELDGVMDYPFRDAAVDFLLMRGDSGALRDALASQLEGYPKPFMRSQLGMLGSHDTERILSVLSGEPVKSGLPRPVLAAHRPTDAELALGRRRLKLASALQFFMPFMPCVYYGDEAGMLGLADPFCRRPYPWGGEDEELLAHYRRLAALRSSEPLLENGLTSFAAPAPDVFAAARSLGAETFLLLINRADSARTAVIDPAAFEGEQAPAFDGPVSVTLGPLSFTLIKKY